MTTMGALLWKEGREHGPRIAIGVAACLSLLLVRQVPALEKGFLQWMAVFMTVPGILAAFLLGADVVSRERERGTAEFLQVLPIRPVVYLAAKMMAGGVGLIAIVGAFVALFYVLPLDPQGYAGRLLAEVPYPTMVAVWAIHFLPVYAFAFLGSSLTDSPLKGLATGLWVYGAAVVGLASLAFLHPEIARFLDRYGGHGFDRDGRLLSLLRHPDIVAGRLALSGSVALAVLAAAAFSFRRAGGIRLGWRPIAAGWAVAGGMGLLLAASPSLQDRLALAYPLADVGGRVSGPAATWHEEQGAIGDVLATDGCAYVTVPGGLRVLDTSRTGELRPAGLVQTEGWRLGRLTRHDGRLFALAMMPLPEGHLNFPGARWPGLAVFEAGDPAHPALACLHGLGDHVDLAFPEEPRQDPMAAVGGPDGLPFDPARVYPWSGDLAVAGDCVYAALFVHAGDSRAARVVLYSARLDGQGRLTRLDELVLGGPDSGLVLRASAPAFLELEIIGQTAYVAVREGILLVDVSDPAALRPVEHSSLGPPGLLALNEEALGYGRVMVREGDELHVESKWPSELVELDVTQPQNPVPVAHRYWSRHGGQAVVHRGLAFRACEPWSDRKQVVALRADAYSWLPVHLFQVPGQRPSRGMRYAISGLAAAGDLLLVAVGDELAAYSLTGVTD